MYDLINRVCAWGKERNLHEADLRPQLIKLTEELGEIAAGVARQDENQIIDGVGDFLVVLIQFGACYAALAEPLDKVEQERLSVHFLEMCLNHSWKEIKDRKGVTKDGIFIKEDE